MLAAVIVVLGLAACGQVSIPSAARTGGDAPSPTETQSSLPPSPITSLPPSPGSPARIVVALASVRLPAGRSRAVAFQLGSQVLICGGLRSGGATSGSILALNVASGSVRQVGSLATAVHDAGGAVLNGAGYVFGGGTLTAGSAIQRISRSGSAATIGALPAVRADLAAVSVDGEIVIVGGGTPALTDGRILATRDGRDVRTIGHLLVPVRYPAVAVLDGLVYVIGGVTPGGDTTAIQELDPATGRVRIAGHLPHPLSHASALVIGTTVVVAGGRSAGRAQDAVMRFAAATGAVSAAGHLPIPASDMAAVVVDGIGYLIGGEATGPIASIVTISIQ